MADPKYANLPGIDSNQPDCYETSDLPEDEQNQVKEEEFENDNIDSTLINADEAFTKFKGTRLDSDNVDFSERLSRKQKTGYAAPLLSEYELLGEGEAKQPETPQQKYQRIQQEIRELAEEVNQIQESMKADSSAESSSAVPMTKQIEYLSHQLSDLKLDKILGAQGDTSLTDPQGALQKISLVQPQSSVQYVKRLMTELAAFKDTKPQGDLATAADGKNATYQIYYRPEQAKFSNSARMSNIEERIERMEANVGSNPERLSSLTSETNNKSLLGAVAILSTKLKLLDSPQLEQVESRIGGLASKLNHLSDKKTQIEKNDDNNKITELYELVKKWDGMREAIPAVTDRLVSLKILHEQALQFNSSLSHLENAQQQISTHLVEHKEMLTHVDKTVAENMVGLQKNLESFDARISALKK